MAYTATRAIRYVHQPKDAESFRLVCADSILRKNALGGVTPETVSWSVQHSVGGTLSTIASASVLATYGLNILVTTDAGTVGGVFSLSTEGRTQIRIDLRQGTEVIDSHTISTIEDGARGSRGPALRVRKWTDVENDGWFYSGADTDTFLDIVIYGFNNNYYQCIRSHQKDSLNPPNMSLSGAAPRWKEVSSFEMIATQILLAERAKINNLVVDEVETTAGQGGLIHIAEGLLHVQGAQGSIDFGVGADGFPVLKYYDGGGTLLYDLGPNGIRMIQGATYTTSWTPVYLKRIGDASASASTIKNGNAYKQVSGATCYYSYFSSNPNDDYSGLIYVGQGNTGGTRIPDGWYCHGQQSGTFGGYPAPLQPGTPGTPQPQRRYNILSKYVDGDLVEELTVYWNI